MKKLSNFKKVMLGVAMAAVLSMGTLGVNATLGVKTGAFSSDWMGNGNYTLKVYSSYASMKATKDSSVYGLMVSATGVQKDGNKVTVTSGKASKGVTISASPKSGQEFKDGSGVVMYNYNPVKVVKFGN